MYRRLGVFVSTLVILISPLFPAGASQYVGWDLFCDPSHALPDDPIVQPGVPGGSHMHEFFGNNSIDAKSTFATASAAGTSCSMPADRAGYWVPTLYKNGKRIVPGTGTMFGKPATIKVRYFATTAVAGINFVAFPPDFRMIAGKSKATSVAGNPDLGRHISWACDVQETRVRRLIDRTAPVNCQSGIVSLRVAFPDCWNGREIDSLDHQAHVRYSGKNFSCPTTHPVHLPPLYLNLEYAIGTSSAGITLASGATFTAHADFWNTWQQPDLEQLVSDCFDAVVWCGTFT